MMLRYVLPSKRPLGSTQDFQTSLDNISSWAATNNMIINAETTQQNHVTLSGPKYETVLQMKGVSVNTTDTEKLLGITTEQHRCRAMETRLYGMLPLERLNKTDYVIHIFLLITFKAHLTHRFFA